jgi:hypothetical protein
VSERFFSCSIALLVAVTSAAIVWIGLDRLSWETRRTTLTVGELRLGTNHFSFETGEGKASCFGALTTTLSDDGNHHSITFQGWLKLALLGQIRIQAFRGELSFNPLGQMGVSLLEIPSGDDVMKIGTKNINPITVLAFRNATDEKPIFQQDLPGPVELRREGALFKITTPIPVDSGLQLATDSMLSVMPFRIKRERTASCTPSGSRPLDVTGVLNTVINLRNRISNTLPLKLP